MQNINEHSYNKLKDIMKDEQTNIGCWLNR